MMVREGASATAAILAGAASLVITGIKVVQYKIEQKELEKHRAAILEIEKLYRQHLQRIPVTGYKNAKFVSLPPLFDEGTEKDPKPKTVLQIEIMEDLYRNTPIFSDPHLREYGHHVRNAMRKLAEFYERRLYDRNWFHRGEKDDITSSTLSYILLMLSEHCIKFEGYSVDIAYLTAMAEFVNAFASIETGQHGERFEQLTETYDQLRKAKAILVDHSISLSMEEMVCQFESDCGNATERMIRLFAKLVLPNEHWRAVDFTSLDHLAEGYVKPDYEYSNGNHHLLWKKFSKKASNAILLPDCVFSSWVQQISHAYVVSLPVTKGLELPMNNHKLMPNWTGPNNRDLKKIKAVFKRSSNILTTTVQEKDQYAATKRFVPVSEDKEVKKRAGIYYNFYQLTDRMNIAQYLCSYIWRDIKKLGEKYVEASHECDYIFQVLQGLGNQIEQFSAKLLKAVEDIELSSQGAMHKSEANILLNELRTLLDAAKCEISPAITAIVEKHTARSRDGIRNDAEVHIEKEDSLLSLTAQIGEAYGIDTGHKVIKPGSSLAGHTHPFVAKNLMAQAQQTAKQVRRENQSVEVLYHAVYQMHRFGEDLTRQDKPKGAMVIQLANELEDELDGFFSAFGPGKPMSSVDLAHFKRDFLDLLHSKDAEMAEHRAAWKPIVANIAIALTAIGIIAILCKLAYSKLSTGHAAFFFSKTRRQVQVAQMDDLTHEVSIAPPAA